MSKSAERTESHVRIESEEDSPIERLQQATGLSKQRIKLAMTQGAVWVTRGRNTRRLRRAKRQLRVGDEVHLYYDAGILAEIPAEPSLVADVGAYSVWNKPYGLRSQGSKWGDHCTVVRWAERHLEPERPAFHGAPPRPGCQRADPGGAHENHGGGVIGAISRTQSGEALPGNRAGRFLQPSESAAHR